MKFSSALLAASVQAFKVGVISDIHNNTRYDPNASPDDECWGSSTNKADYPMALARYGCDPSPQLIEYMFQRFNEAFGKVDVLLVTGDFVGHGIDPHRESYTDAEEEFFKSVVTDTAGLLAKHFPDTVILPTLGNNDGQYHSSAPDESSKADFLGFMYETWFTDIVANKSISAGVKDTYMTAGHYRVDLTSNLSVLTLNSQYMDLDDDTSYQANEALLQLDWLEQQLKNAGDRKFIISTHVYSGARYHASNLWHDDFASRYFQILRDYHDVVSTEIAGHDHYVDLRYHSSDHVRDFPDPSTSFDFHNIFVAPGITPNKGQNPGVAMLDIGEDGTPSSLKVEFINIGTLEDKTSASYSDLEFLSLDMAKDFGINDLTPKALSDFRKQLEDPDNYDWAMNYLVWKMGFNINDPDQVAAAQAIYTTRDLITSKKHKIGEYLCQMHKSITADEFQACCDSANQSVALFLQ